MSTSHAAGSEQLGKARRRKLVSLLVGGLTVAAVGFVPLATSAPPAVAIDGADSLNDEVEVHYRSSSHTSDIHILGFNDFHGNLEPAALNLYRRYTGGAAYLSKLLKDRQAAYPGRVVTVHAGDAIGATPLISGNFFDEPTIVAFNHMNVDIASVGNHEFDRGRAHLLRMQRGGCDAGGCTAAPYAVPGGSPTNTFPGARFQYLATNVLDNTTGESLFPRFAVRNFTTSSGATVRIGFIGETLEATPTIVTPSGVAGLRFVNEATAANQAVRDLANQGVKIPVLVIHQGGFQTGAPSATNSCAGNLAGSDIETIVKSLDPAIKVIVSGHTHAEYRCTITFDGVTRLVTSASSFGRVLSDITLTVDDQTGELASASATNLLVENATNADNTTARVDDPSKADPAVRAIVDQYRTQAAPLTNRVIGKINADLPRAQNAQGESLMGDVIADSMLFVTRAADKGGAQVALMNIGGVRADLLVSQISGGEQPGEVTYGEAFTVQPFGNSLVVMTLTGAQIRSVLEQQFVGCGGQTTQRIMQVSNGFRYEINPGAATCADKIGKIQLNSVDISPSGTYRVVVNNFMATGGDGYTVFNSGRNLLGGELDIDALALYLRANASGLSAPERNRILAAGSLGGAAPQGTTTTTAGATTTAGPSTTFDALAVAIRVPAPTAAAATTVAAPAATAAPTTAAAATTAATTLPATTAAPTTTVPAATTTAVAQTVPPTTTASPEEDAPVAPAQEGEPAFTG